MRADGEGASRAAGPPATRTAALLPSRADCGRALRRTPVSVWNDDVMDWAAALTYYAVLAIFPALLVTVSAMGVAPSGATQQLIDRVTVVLPAQSGDFMAGVLKGMAEQHTAAWLLAVFGTVGSLWSASSYLSVFRRALHAMHGVKDHRPLWRTAPRIVLTALALLALLISSVFVLVLSGDVARGIGGFLGMDEMAANAWRTMRWPLLLCLVAVLVLILFRSGPAGTHGARKGALGGALAVLLWLVASLGFALYASNVGTFHRLYGSLAGIVVFFVWLWVSNLALLCGAQFNAELAKLRRGREETEPPVSAARPPRQRR
ncbi:MAG: YihY/virulence factor BrkB family protein [Streptomyces sp.]|uniref:YihY/virulence factor BrkB family protein n=1 Tax=Streptomyces sp. TaxID=1931 RepID=UPI003D6C4D81